MQFKQRFIHTFKENLYKDTWFINSVDDSWYQQSIQFNLYYQPPYIWTAMLGYLSKRAIPGVEIVQDNYYARTVLLHNSTSGKPVKGWLQVKESTESNSLLIEMSSSLIPEWNTIIQKLRHLFDLEVNPEIINKTLNEDWVTKGLRVPGAFNGFELGVRAILGQQITVKAATTISGRLVHALGTPFKTKITGLDTLFPIPEKFVCLAHGDIPISDVLGPLGVTGRRSNTIAALAEALVIGEIQLNPIVQGVESILPFARHTAQMETAEVEMKQLLAIKGIGNWTAQYIGMRALGYTDSFLETDIGIKNAMPNYTTPKSRLAAAEKWHPLRSYAVVNLWNTLN
ncbi:DNA-3-methyladenine glycosylase 2 family protein [Staphylococcus condimenti]|nr:DNA-3-methyladenine glycosylase 2 family protein [Staphylococcus condimenti]